MISKTEEELKKELHIFNTFSNETNMEFRIDKSPYTVLKKGYLLHTQNIILEFYRQIQQLERKKI
jgi:hypothetical protein